MNRKRLDFEALRDALLAASGQLDPTRRRDRRSICCDQPWPTRRTIYGRIDRQNLPNMFRTFDFASPDTHSPQRFTTTVPQQALYLMNSPFVPRPGAASWPRGRSSLTPDPPADKVERLYEVTLAREPTDADELALGVNVSGRERQPRRPRASGAAACNVVGALRAGRAAFERVYICGLNVEKCQR